MLQKSHGGKILKSIHLISVTRLSVILTRLGSREDKKYKDAISREYSFKMFWLKRRRYVTSGGTDDVKLKTLIYLGNSVD